MPYSPGSVLAVDDDNVQVKKDPPSLQSCDYYGSHDDDDDGQQQHYPNNTSSLQRRMFIFFAIAQFLQIGSYWLIRPVKSGIFARLVGDDKEALVRIILTPMLFFLLIGYNILIQTTFMSPSSSTTTSTVVGYLAAPFAIIFISSWLLMVCVGLDNTPAIIGWILALASECMCPILVTLNWSIISQAAKDYSSSIAAKAFPMITMACQFGCLFGSTITNYLAILTKGDNDNDDVDDAGVGTMTMLLPVLLCGLSLCGMWACMVKADYCHIRDIAHRGARNHHHHQSLSSSSSSSIHLIHDDDGNNNDDSWVNQYQQQQQHTANKKNIPFKAVSTSSSTWYTTKMIVDGIRASTNGLTRIIRSYYVLSIFIVSTAYEYFDTVFDLQLKHLFTQKAILDCQGYNDNDVVDDECRHAHFLANYSRTSLHVAILSTLLAIASAILHAKNTHTTTGEKENDDDDKDTQTLGVIYNDDNENVKNTSSSSLWYKIRTSSSLLHPSSLFGPTFPLLIYPILVGICFSVIAITTTINDTSMSALVQYNPLIRNIYYLVGTTGTALVRETIAVQTSVMAVKAFGYTLNNPAKEMLYLHTTQDVRFQAKSWIDIWCPKIWSSLAATVWYNFTTTMILPDTENRYYNIIDNGSTYIDKYNILYMTIHGMNNMGIIAIVGLFVLVIWSLAAIYAITQFNIRETTTTTKMIHKEEKEEEEERP